MSGFWCCPLCSHRLVFSGSAAVCEQNHCFDFAKQGYLNLLPANFKHSKSPGDDKAMLSARRRFLQQGHYNPLLKQLEKLQHDFIRDLADGQGVITALDIGGGEGYFAAHLQKANQSIQWFVTDISKDAVKLAAPQYDKGRCAVASSFKIPVADKSVDLLLRNFAPSSDQELQRILKAKGLCVFVTPGPNHLLELRQLIYQAPKQHAPPETPAGFRLSQSLKVTYESELADPSERDHIFSMTPMVWKADQSVKSLWLDRDCKVVTFDFLISVYALDHD